MDGIEDDFYGKREEEITSTDSENFDQFHILIKTDKWNPISILWMITRRVTW